MNFKHYWYEKINLKKIIIIKKKKKKKNKKTKKQKTYTQKQIKKNLEYIIPYTNIIKNH